MVDALRRWLMLDNRRVRLFMVANIVFHLGILGLSDVVLNFYFVSLGYDVGTIALLQTLPRLGGMLTSIPVGLVTNRIGAYRVILLATLGCALAFALTVLFPVLPMLAFSRFLLGFMYGAYQIAVPPYMMALVEKEAQTRFFAYHNVVSVGSIALGSVIGGSVPALMVQLFAPLVPAAAVANAQTPFAYGAALLLAGLLILVSAVPFMAIGEGRAPHRAEEDSEKAKRLPIPWLQLAYLSLPMLTYGVTGGLTFPFFNLFFRTQFDLSDQSIGSILSLGWLGMALLPLILPIWEKYLGRAGTLAVTMGIGAVGYWGMAVAPSLGLTVVAFVVGVSFRNTLAPLFPPLAMASLPAGLHNAMSSMNIIAWNIGWMSSTAISGVLQQTIGFRPIMEIVAVGVVFTGLCTFIIFRRREAVGTLPSSPLPTGSPTAPTGQTGTLA